MDHFSETHECEVQCVDCYNPAKVCYDHQGVSACNEGTKDCSDSIDYSLCIGCFDILVERKVAAELAKHGIITGAQINETTGHIAVDGLEFRF